MGKSLVSPGNRVRKNAHETLNWYNILAKIEYYFVYRIDEKEENRYN